MFSSFRDLGAYTRAQHTLYATLGHKIHRHMIGLVGSSCPNPPGQGLAFRIECDTFVIFKKEGFLHKAKLIAQMNYNGIKNDLNTILVS